MKRIYRNPILAVLVCALALLPIVRVLAQQKPAADLRALFKQGNYKDAYDGLAPQVLAAAGTDQLEEDFSLCMDSLSQLGRYDEMDDFRDKAIAAHQKDWRFLLAAAESVRDAEHFGNRISGTFYRGRSRNGDGRWLSALDRDRTRALQLMREGGVLLAADTKATAAESADYYYQIAATLLEGENGQDAWRLQVLTDLTQLPDYQESDGPYRYWGRQTPRGAAVEDQGNPVIHQIPAGGWDGATTDGQRWRWAIQKASELSPVEAQRANTMLAQFWLSQFGVQTMAGFARPGIPPVDGKVDESGPYAVYSLKDEETIARLANGIKRFNLSDDVNPIKLFEAIAANTVEKKYAEEAMGSLAEIYEDRQQYTTAQKWYEKLIQQFGDFPNGYRHGVLNQIIGNLGRIEDVLVQPAGDAGAKFDFRFRNGNKVTFSARQINAAMLLADVRNYIKSQPMQLDYQTTRLDEIGYRLITQNQDQYIGTEAVNWDLNLSPRADHFDRRVTVQSPLKKAGAYLVTAQMAGGNLSRAVVWVSDVAIINKPMQGQSFTFVADAATGKPIAGAQVSFFGYRQEWVKENTYRIDTQEYASKTNADGELILDTAPALNQDQIVPPINPTHPALRQGLDWLTVATTPDFRMAFTGFDSVWSQQNGDDYDSNYNQVKAFIMTDRPVYRPDQKVQIKLWVGENKYDQDGKSPWAGKHTYVQIFNPRREVVKQFEGDLDEWGGLTGDFDIGHNASLGEYQILVWRNGFGNGPVIDRLQFRVEEYKKPEFEVKVDAPTEPVMLGDKITATINAKYYFGSPVVNAKVHYTVTRTSFASNWYPAAQWDWFYEPGYWWFAADYGWYPGFWQWGMRRPAHGWWPGAYSNEQPEVVGEAEVPVGVDGTVKVVIDTAVAKAAYGDRDHKYTITAEVTDSSRRTIVGSGDVLVARQPFKVYAWVDHGFYTAGQTVHAYFTAQTLSNKPVQGNGTLKLNRITYDAAAKPSEEQVQQWDLDTKADGTSDVQMVAARAGQYRLSYNVTDPNGHAIEGGYIFAVRGEGFTGADYHFNDVEITTDKKEYKAGEKVQLMINTDRQNATVLLFIRPSNGVYLPPQVIQMQGKSMVQEVEVGTKDMPNFFVEALTISGAKVSTDVREVIVPPENRMLDVAVTADAQEFKPGQKAKLTVKVTEKGLPFTGAAVLSLYDKAVEYISGGSNISDIRQFFWKWRRTHYVNGDSSLNKSSNAGYKQSDIALGYLGVFGEMATESGGDNARASYWNQGDIVPELREAAPSTGLRAGGRGGGGRGGRGGIAVNGERLKAETRESAMVGDSVLLAGEADNGGKPPVQPTMRSNFADTAFWAPKLVTATDGIATVEVTMPDNLTTWKARVWTIGNGSRVGQGDTEVVTRKNLIVRLESPRFFVQNDDVVLSAIVHNYLKTAKHVKVQLALDGGSLVNRDGPQAVGGPAGISNQSADIEVPANGEQRVDFWAHARDEGNAMVSVKAITDEESDAMQMSFPVYVHGMLKTESFAGALRPSAANDLSPLTGLVKFTVPNQRRPEQSLLEVQYSPSLASAMVDALPYMVEYPYGCTEQTLNRFLPTVITQKILKDMHLDLAAIQQKRTNLNAQELGNATTRAAKWKRFDRNPVFDESLVANMARDGVSALADMQLNDGGWGWFSGSGEQSYPHTTALVMHGLQMAQENGVTVNGNVLERGKQWLMRDQETRLAWIKEKRAERKAENMDAFEYMVLVDAGQDNPEMRQIIYDDRNNLSVYTKAMFGLAMLKMKDQEKLDMMIQNCRQYLVQDDENQTAYLKLPPDSWYYWWGSENEAQAYYLKLLARTDPKGQVASRLAKYILNNRKNSTWWNSTRDTALCIEALADFIRASGEDRPDMTVKLSLDGKEVKSEKITADNLFTFDNHFAISGSALTDGAHTLEITREGSGPLYYNAYLSNFTMEDHITRAGLEIKVNRKVYLLTQESKTIKAEGAHGQAVDQKVDKYVRTELADGQSVKSGDLVEVELTVDSKNDYEYILLEDMKAAGFEPVEVRSGYNGNDMDAYVEFHDERVAFFVRELGRGTHSVSYRLRAEAPGAFSALPTKATALYAPELRANSDEIKLRITDEASPIK